MMPALALIDVPGPDWLPPLPVFVFLLWPFVWAAQGLAWLLRTDHPETAERLRLAARAFQELRGLEVDLRSHDHHRIHIRFV